MVPLSSLVTVTPTFGPEMVVRYNGYGGGHQRRPGAGLLVGAGAGRGRAHRA